MFFPGNFELLEKVDVLSFEAVEASLVLHDGHVHFLFGFHESPVDAVLLRVPASAQFWDQLDWL